VFMVLTSVFLVFFFALVGLQLKSKKDRALFGKNFAELKIDLSELGIKGEKIEDFLGEVETFSLKFGEKEGNINIKKVEGGTLRNKIVEIREKRVPELKSKKEQNTEVIHKIKEITFVNNLKEFGESLRKKETIEREMEKEERVLKEILGQENRKKKIKEFKVFKDKSKDVEFNEKEYDNLSKEISFAREKLGEWEGKSNILSERFKEVEKKANNILDEKDLRCHGAMDLENIERKTQDFIEEKETSKNDAIISLKIIEEIANQEKTKIREQFGQKNPVSKYFSKMTEGLYTAVEFEEKKEKIEVIRKDEVTLSPWQLSGGTYDQLYFSIRLALGEKLFGEERGFFILDDPFIKASRNRLIILMKMLKNISKSGWQIIYFSAKEEVREILGKDKKVKFIELESIL